jgi:hypothetical protein
MKKALFISILSLFLCTSFAFATSEATGINFEGTVATVKDGVLDATISIDLAQNESSFYGSFYVGKVTIKIYKDSKAIYDKTFPCTVYDNQTMHSLTITTTSPAILYGNYDPVTFKISLVLQIPEDGITGKFIQVASVPAT